MRAGGRPRSHSMRLRMSSELASATSAMGRTSHRTRQQTTAGGQSLHTSGGDGLVGVMLVDAVKLEGWALSFLAELGGNMF